MKESDRKRNRQVLPQVIGNVCRSAAIAETAGLASATDDSLEGSFRKWRSGDHLQNVVGTPPRTARGIRRHASCV